ncbi:MAG: riboflavin kinase [Crocinitomicaceae bacterium]
MSKQLGRTFGFPTANLDLSNLKLLQLMVFTLFCNSNTNGEKRKGLLSIGTNPTIAENGQRAIEVCLLDFQGSYAAQF